MEIVKSKAFSNQSLPENWTHRKAIWEGNHIITAEVFQAVKSLKAGKAEVESDQKCSKPWTEELFGLFISATWPGVLEAQQKIGKLW